MSRIVVAVAFLALVAVLAARAAQHAATPPFELAIVPRERTRIAVEGLAFQVLGRDSVVEVRARAARPGHFELGPFSLAPATSLVLDDVSVIVSSGAGSFTVTGREADLKGRKLRVRGAVQRIGGVATAHHAMTVDLNGGSARAD